MLAPQRKSVCGIVGDASAYRGRGIGDVLALKGGGFMSEPQNVAGGYIGRNGRRL